MFSGSFKFYFGQLDELDLYGELIVDTHAAGTIIDLVADDEDELQVVYEDNITAIQDAFEENGVYRTDVGSFRLAGLGWVIVGALENIKDMSLDLEKQ